MKIFRVEHNINRYCGFQDRRMDLFDSIFKQMLEGRSIAKLWSSGQVDIIPGRKGDFIGGPTLFARIGVRQHTLELVGPYIEPIAELLPFEFHNDNYWGVYLPKAYDCLDFEFSEFWGNDRDPSQIRKVIFCKAKIPTDLLFRIRGSFDYYAKDEFKKLVEESGLTGLTFREVWRDETFEQGEEAIAPQGSAIAFPKRRSKTESLKPGAYTRKSGRTNKRERLLLRLWRDVINHRGTEEWLQEELNAQDQEDEDFPFLSDASRVLKKATAAGLSGEDLRRLARGIAYQVVFDAAVAIDEECALKAPYAGLHEDLLMAGSDPSADVADVE